MNKTLPLFLIIALSSAQVFAQLINEIRTDQPSWDNDEYFELVGTPRTSLNGLTYIVIGDGRGGSGAIESVIDLTGYSINVNGYFVAAERTFTLGTADLTTSLNFENDDNVTHLLVSGFTGSRRDDLDTDDDGILDSTPWSNELDRIAIIKEDNPPRRTEYHYGPPTIGPDGSSVPGYVFREPSGGTWKIGQFDIISGGDTPGGDPPLPVELVYFNAEPMNKGILLKWRTESEIENIGFFIERKTADTGWREIVSYKQDESLLGQGTVSFATDYEYVDKLVQQGNTYEYRLADVDYNGVVTYHSTREVLVENSPLATIADNFTVMAYPNPFNPSTTIRYSIPAVQTHSNASVLIAIHDISGKLITTLVNKEQSSGWYEIQWNGTNQTGKEMPGGVYLSRVTVGNKVKTNKLILLK